jgi:flavin-dependent dehydrogenase
LEFVGVAAAYGPRRRALDKVSVDAAVEAGAELRQGFVIEDYVVDGDRVIGSRSRGLDCADKNIAQADIDAFRSQMLPMRSEIIFDA